MSISAIKVIDSLGVFTASICSIHCLLMPFLLVGLVGMGFNNEIFDLAFIIIAPTLGLLSLSIGWLRHKNVLPILNFSLGFIALLCGHLLFEYALGLHTMLMVSGGLSVIVSHKLNQAYMI